MQHSTAREPARICRGCWDQMRMPIPIRGPLALPFQAFGVTRSKMNPNICTICERSFSFVKKQRHISADATILFADIRGYTSLSERMDAVAMTKIVGIFHDLCAQAIWNHDGIVNKQMGDGVMAIFNFPIRNERHAAAAISAAIEVQQRCATALKMLAESSTDHTPDALGVGIGVHTGMVAIGEFSSFRSDFTAIGGTVNLTSRLESQAAAGEIVISAEAAAQATELMSDAVTRAFSLKGFEHVIQAHVLTAAKGISSSASH